MSRNFYVFQVLRSLEILKKRKNQQTTKFLLNEKCLNFHSFLNFLSKTSLSLFVNFRRKNTSVLKKAGETLV